MNPVHTIAHILEHALVGHKKVTIFEASLTTAEEMKGDVNAEVGARLLSEGLSLLTTGQAPCVSWTVTEEINQTSKEVCF